MSTTFSDVLNVTSSMTSSNESSDQEEADDRFLVFGAVIKVVVPVLFGAIELLGLVGNLLVIVVVVRNRLMRSTTNALIVSLAVADLVFIVVCVPLTGLGYAGVQWPFGTAVCRLYQIVIHVTAYCSVYTLVLMSLDRYLAVVHPIRSLTLRTERNALALIAVVWALIAVGHAPSFTDFDVWRPDNETALCINIRLTKPDHRRYGQIFYGTFFAFGYIVPLTLVCLLYGCMIRRLLFGDSSSSSSSSDSKSAAASVRRRSNSAVNRPRASTSGRRMTTGLSSLSETVRARRRVTRLVVVVVIIFAACWLPLHVAFVLQFYGSESVSETIEFNAVKIAASCLAYMNSCVNPILYAFLSDNFRKSFRRLVYPVAAVCFRWSPVPPASFGPSGTVIGAGPRPTEIGGRHQSIAGYGLLGNGGVGRSAAIDRRGTDAEIRKTPDKTTEETGLNTATSAQADAFPLTTNTEKLPGTSASVDSGCTNVTSV